MTTRLIVLLVLVASLAACSSVDVTKTGKGFYDATDPNEIEILKTEPKRAFEELGTVTAAGFSSSATAKMHNAIRSEAAKLGANAVIIQEEGLTPGGFGSYDRWCTGVALRYK